MKKFKFESGQVLVEVKTVPFTNNVFYEIRFIGFGLWGWGISKRITKKQYDDFNVTVAKEFADEVEPMLAV